MTRTSHLSRPPPVIVIKLAALQQPGCCNPKVRRYPTRKEEDDAKEKLERQNPDETFVVYEAVKS